MCGSFALYLDLKMQAPERIIDWQFNDLDLFVGSFRAFRRAVANLRAHLPPLRVRRIGRPYQITAVRVPARASYCTHDDLELLWKVLKVLAR